MFTTASQSLRKITFVKAKLANAQNAVDPEKLGLIPLNDLVEVPDSSAMTRSQSKKPVGTDTGKPKLKELFREEDMCMQWTHTRKPGSGLQNLGNTCFMNSVLQCLIHTPPLAELLISDVRLGNGIAASASKNGFDPLGMTRELLRRSLGAAGKVAILQPVQHAKSLKKVSKSFRLGRQEDAHEYLIALLNAIHECSISHLNPKPTPDQAMTSFIYRIFSGKIRSQVKCTDCSYESNTYEPFLDLSLEIARADSVTKALERFTTGEVLEGANSYKCTKQNKPVKAVKRITIEKAPNVLIIQLKRFSFLHSGRKLAKKVEYDATLDLGPYMSHQPQDLKKKQKHKSSSKNEGNNPTSSSLSLLDSTVYDLYGVLVHAGHSLHSGHYYAYIKGASGGWFLCDDHQVTSVGERNVLSQKAYILFYIRRGSKHQQHQKQGILKTNGSIAPPLVKHTTRSDNVQVDSDDDEEEEEGKGKGEEEENPFPPTKKTALRNLNVTKRKQPEENSDDDEDTTSEEADKENDDTKTAIVPTNKATTKNEGKVGRLQAMMCSGVSTKRAPTIASPTSGRILNRDPRVKTRRNGSIDAGLENFKVLDLMLRSRTLERHVKLTSPQIGKKAKQQQQQKKKEVGVVAVSEKGQQADNNNNNSDSSTVSAPEWPPVKPSIKKEAIKTIADGGKTTATVVAGLKTAAAAAMATGAQAKKALQASARRGGLGVGTWDFSDDNGTKKKHQDFLKKPQAEYKKNKNIKRARYDDYDAEYDAGKLKKVKKRGEGEGPGTGPGAAAFDAFGLKGKGGNRGGGRGDGKGRGMYSTARGRGRGGGRGRGRDRGRGRGRDGGRGRGGRGRGFKGGRGVGQRRC